MKAVDKESYLAATGAHSVRMTRRGSMTAFPKHAKDLPEPSLKEMLDENRKQRKNLLKRAKRGEDVRDELHFVRRRAKWIKHHMREMAKRNL